MLISIDELKIMKKICLVNFFFSIVKKSEKVNGQKTFGEMYEI